MTIQTKDFAAPFNKYFNIKKSLSWKMEAFFTTPEQRAQNIEKYEKSSSSARTVGIPICLVGAVPLLIGIIKIVPIASDAIDLFPFMPFLVPAYEQEIREANAWLWSGLIVLGVGSIFIASSHYSADKANFWKSTLE